METILPGTLPTDHSHHRNHQTHSRNQNRQHLPPEAANKWWYEMVESTENPEQLAQGSSEGTAIWVTDGSYKAPYGSAAFILKPSIDSEISIKIVNQAPGRAENMDAYQAEVAGIYGCVAFTNDFLQTHNITQAAATMACDCLSALRNIFDKELDRPSQAHYSIVHACRLLLRESPATWTPWHVYGH
jgi:hypothetical protein